jgi:hypothetical protein
MFHIPEEVFEHQILPFLRLDETSALLSSSNTLFEELRYRCGKRNFKVSLHQLTETRFIQFLLQKINPSEQLIVSCSHCFHETVRCHDILTNGFMMKGQPFIPRRLCTCTCCGPVTDISNIQELSFIAARSVMLTVFRTLLGFPCTIVPTFVTFIH